MNDDKRTVPVFAEFARAGRSTYLRVNLDTIFNNINILRARCYSKTGNASTEDIPFLVKYSLTPTVAELEFLEQFGSALTQDQRTVDGNGICNGEDGASGGQVVIKVDTGMSRNGCQPQQLAALVQFCREHNLKVHSIMTHFSQAWDNPVFTQKQLDIFMQCAGKYRKSGIKLHVSNSVAIIRGYGTDLDFIRPGICMFGLPPDSSDATVECVKTLGIRPALSWVAHPTLVKQIPPGSHVGYDNTYTTSTKETIATFALGFADGFNRQLSGKFSVSLEANGVTCPVIGKVSMDAITVQLDTARPKNTVFYIYRDDFTSRNSVTKIASLLDTIPHEVITCLAARLPRVFVSEGQTVAVTKSLIMNL